jgi:hypothetical protein
MRNEEEGIVSQKVNIGYKYSILRGDKKEGS